MNDKLWQRLPEKELEVKDYQIRVLRFDPVMLPSLFTVKPYQRHQIVGMRELFPSVDGKCGCGCDELVKKPRRRWATNECEKFAVAVRFIVAGSLTTIAHYLRAYYGWRCSICGCGDKGHDMGANGCVSWIKVDHIIPVKLGGGACWLSNYQLLCHDCHVSKTNKDFNWKQPEETNQIPLFPLSSIDETEMIREKLDVIINEVKI